MPHFVDNQGRDGDHRRRPSRSPHQKTPEFRFSIEMGLLVRSRQIDHKTVQGLQKELSTRLAISGVTNQHIAVTNGCENFKDWTISASLAISSKPKEHKFGLRLVSPFMPFAWFEVWKAQIRTVLHVLNTEFETTATHQCSTHINLVPIKGYWRLSQAISLAKSAIYFEPCLDRLMPLYRRKCVWAKSNRWNKYLGKYNLSDCFDRLSAQDTFEGLAARMSWTSMDSPSGLALAQQTDFTHDAYRWNFSPAGDTSGFGQIEFRQPPGITESSDMISWITLVVLFAQVSVTSADTAIRPSKPPQLSKLAELIYAQAAETRVPKGRVSLIKNTIFEQANPPPAQAKPADAAMAGNPDPKDITIDEDQRLRWVHKEGGGVGNTIARAKYWSLLEDLRPPGRDGMMVISPHW